MEALENIRLYRSFFILSHQCVEIMRKSEYHMVISYAGYELRISFQNSFLFQRLGRKGSICCYSFWHGSLYSRIWDSMMLYIRVVWFTDADQGSSLILF